MLRQARLPKVVESKANALGVVFAALPLAGVCAPAVVKSDSQQNAPDISARGRVKVMMHISVEDEKSAQHNA